MGSGMRRIGVLLAALLVLTGLPFYAATAESSFTGVVESIEIEKNAVSVVVSMFGRETPVEFELDQVEVVSQ